MKSPILKNVKQLLILAIVPVLLIGCATIEIPDLVWPEPPDTPRVKYTRQYTGGADFQSKNKAADILLGARRSLVLKKPKGVHVAKDGKIYVTDTAAGDVFILDPVNKTANSVNSMGAKYFFKPIGVTTDDQNRIFITDSQTDKVIVLDQEGKVLATLVPKTPFKQPSGIAADSERNRLYVIDTHNHHIEVFALDTLKHEDTIGKRGQDEGEFNFPSNITVDTQGHVYVVDTMNGRVQIFDSEGRFINMFGQFGDVSGMFARPKGIGVDSEGHIYVVDAAFNNVQIFNQEGEPMMAFIGYGDDRGGMILPSGIAIGPDDYIYVVDSWNRRVKVLEYLGEKHDEREKTGRVSPVEPKKN
jgi:DNA-binding beta-propeller fold protein YncE